MTKTVKWLKTLAKQFKKHYSFLADVNIDIAAGYGVVGATAYKRKENSIYVDLKALRNVYETPRFRNRFGRVNTFEAFVILVLLHEVYHVWQEKNLPPNRLNAALLEIQPFDVQTHDESWVETDADKWARKESKRWRV